ncbi:MAG TPA: fumarylacetoacetate hydrolase family protein [Thermoanaerobacterales bacterium]|nr:fumarylacetoacetate hydrolase family protein [Thermoanaerobacterales bacterium]
MKYATFKFNGMKMIGALLDEYLVDVQRAYALYLKEVEKDNQADEMARVLIPDDFIEFLEAGEKSWEAAKTAYNFVKDMDKETLGINEEYIFYPLKNVKILEPLRPRTIMAPGPELEDPSDKSMYNYIEFYLKSEHAVVGPGVPIIKESKFTGRIDFEPELALVIGKRGRFLDRENVLDHVFGYTIMNDVYSIDRLVVGWEGTMFHVRYGEGASFDNSAPIGPWIVTKDEIENPENLTLRKYVNGELVDERNTSQLLRSVREFASYCSTYFTLQPGLMIATGYPNGLVFGKDSNNRPVIKDLRKSPRYLNADDRVACEIEGIGRLENLVIEFDGGNSK